MKLTHVFFLVFFMLTSNVGNTQSKAYADSIRNNLYNLEEQDRILDLLRLSFYYAPFESDSSFYFVEEAGRIAYKYKDTLNQIRYLRIKGVAFYEINQTDSMLYYYEKGASFSKEVGEDLQLAHFNNNIGNHYLSNSKYADAVQYFLEAKKMYDKVEERGDQAMVAGNLAATYHSMGDIETAITYNLEARSLQEELKDSTGLLNTTSLLASMYEEKREYDKADSINQKLFELATAQGSKVHLAQYYSQDAALHQRNNNLNQSVVAFNKAINIQETLSNKSPLIHMYARLGDVYQGLGKYRKGLEMADKSLSLSDDLGIEKPLQLSLIVKSTCHFLLGEEEEGTAAIKKWIANTEKEFTEERASIISEMEVVYETEKKEQQIAYQQIEIAKQKATNRLQLGLSIGGLLLLTLLGILWYNRNRYKKKIEFEQLQAIAQKEQFQAVVSAQEKERERIARDLHDGLGQMLSAAKMNVSAIEGYEEPELIDSSLEIIDSAVQEVRNVSHDLMPKLLAEKGLIVALEDIADRVSRNKTLEFSIQSSIGQLQLEKTDQIIIYRIIQELVNNSIKHADADKIELSIDEKNEQAIFSLSDNGKGVTTEQLMQSSGIGWQNIQSRIQYLKGQLKLQQRQPKGSLFLITIPQ